MLGEYSRRLNIFRFMGRNWFLIFHFQFSLNLAPPSCFYQENDPDDSLTRGLKIGILTVLEDDGGPTLLSRVQNIAVVLEEDIVLTDLTDLPTAFALLFGLLYALNINFPKENGYTFEVIETIFMKLSTNCSHRVRNLKTKLLL